MAESFAKQATKVGVTAAVSAGLMGWALGRTNLSAGWRGAIGAAVGVAAGAIVGQKLPNVGMGLIAGGVVVGGNQGARAIANMGLMTPTSTTTTTPATTTTTTTSTSNTSNTSSNTPNVASSTGLGLGSGSRPRGLGAGVQRPRVVPMNANRLAAALGPHLIAGKRLR